MLYLENGIDEESNICEDKSEQSINGKNDDVEFSGDNQNNQKETIEEKVRLYIRYTLHSEIIFLRISRFVLVFNNPFECKSLWYFPVCLVVYETDQYPLD